MSSQNSSSVQEATVGIKGNAKDIALLSSSGQRAQTKRKANRVEREKLEKEKAEEEKAEKDKAEKDKAEK